MKLASRLMFTQQTDLQPGFRSALSLLRMFKAVRMRRAHLYFKDVILTSTKIASLDAINN